ncbi:MAG: hypothetical protein JOZ72_17910 [Alphaproteobacteria bacterium]|nr:hypothetical protein [Alphaproteobacteria bacterium]
MKKLRDWLGADKGTAAPAPPSVRTVDPARLLYSLATIATDDYPLEPMAGPPGEADLVFHEDDWRQIEFLAHDRRDEIARKLTSLKAFEARNRVAGGYREIFERELDARPVLAGPAAMLGCMFGAAAGPGPVLFHGGGEVAGRVADAFSLPLAGKVWLYGMHDLSVLGAAMPPGADNEVLARAFMTLSKSHGLILVDWRAQMLLLKVADEGNLEVWRP